MVRKVVRAAIQRRVRLKAAQWRTICVLAAPTTSVVIRYLSKLHHLYIISFLKTLFKNCRFFVLFVCFFISVDTKTHSKTCINMCANVRQDSQMH